MTTFSSTDPVSLAQALIRCPSVTPEEGGALHLLKDVLEGAGFTVHLPEFAAPHSPTVQNLYARIGMEAPVLVLAGHTDVVPPGDAAAWTHPPFGGAVQDGVLHGRGAVDMKGGVAAMTAAALRHLESTDGALPGSIVFLITGDEEGPAVNGTVKLLEWAAARGERFDHCLLGEPTSMESLGDTLKIGRRGSLSGTLTVQGVQGHVAYPHRAKNPMRTLPAMLAALMEPLDEGTAHFEASNLEVVSIDTGNAAFNVIPAAVMVRFNIRLNDAHSIESLGALLRERLRAAAPDTAYTLTLHEGASEAFLTPPGDFVDELSAAVKECTGREPKLSTGGGTSDARFIKNYCPVVELGLVGNTMHQVDERVPVAELEALTQIYEAVLKRYFA